MPRILNLHPLSGSPPRAWGLGSCIFSNPSRWRFTPTGVGTGWAKNCGILFYSVHPHGRGDWFYDSSNMKCSDGSPPRAWGLGQSSTDTRSGCRFTPTGVGTGHLSTGSRRGQSVHPHGRGDWVQRKPKEVSPLGSPPRAWGLGPVVAFEYAFKRFTPTGVGTGLWWARSHQLFAVHPHGRGDWPTRSQPATL